MTIVLDLVSFPLHLSRYSSPCFYSSHVSAWLWFNCCSWIFCWVVYRKLYYAFSWIMQNNFALSWIQETLLWTKMICMSCVHLIISTKMVYNFVSFHLRRSKNGCAVLAHAFRYWVCNYISVSLVTSRLGLALWFPVKHPHYTSKFCIWKGRIFIERNHCSLVRFYAFPMSHIGTVALSTQN